MRVLRVVALAFIAVSVLVLKARAFNAPTHETMNETAVTQDADFNDFLRADLAFSLGVGQKFGANSVTDWIKYGGNHEDEYGSVNPLAWRFNRHFHDPLVDPWTAAGLDVAGEQFESSVVWMQDSTSNGWSWQQVRNQYYFALTSPTPENRDFRWADTFHGIGQVMHLIEDAASPAHVRDDSHAMGTVCHKMHLDCGANLEYWVSDRRNDGKFSYDLTAANPRFDRTILCQSTGHNEAPVPVARLIDTDLYHGSDANETWPTAAIGIGEFTNANFFSEGTVSNSKYAHPDLSTLVLTSSEDMGDGTFHQYYRKGDTDGYPVDPVATASVLTEALQQQVYPPGTQPPNPFSLDEAVWEAEARILVPKAVDYAQGALDYFFRGRIDFACDYADPESPCLIKNLGDENLYGTFKLYAEDAAGKRTVVDSAVWSNLFVAAHDVTRVSRLDAPDSADRYVLVFRGKMGLEQDAVAGKVIPNGFLLMTYSATYRTRGASWEKLTQGPIPFDFHYDLGRENLYAPTQERPFAGGDAVGDHVFASFGIDDQWRVTPVWMSQDGGFSFTDVSNAASFGVLYSVTALNDTELLAGFYQRDADGWPSGNGGVAYSSDGGQSWQVQANLTVWSQTGPGVLHIGNNTALVGGVETPDGSSFMQSTDKGINWQPLKPWVDGVESCWDVTAMAWNHVAGAGSVLLAGGSACGGWFHSVWKSVDGGRTWKTVWTRGMYLSPFATYWQPIAVAISPSGEALMILEARWGCRKDPVTGECRDNSCSECIDFPKWVWKSLDAGETWAAWSGPEGDTGPGGGDLTTGGVIGQDIGVMYLANTRGGP